MVTILRVSVSLDCSIMQVHIAGLSIKSQIINLYWGTAMLLFPYFHCLPNSVPYNTSVLYPLPISLCTCMCKCTVIKYSFKDE